MLDDVVGAVALVTAGAFTVGAAHKVHALARGATPPLIRVAGPLRRHPRASLVAALLAETTTLVLLTTSTPTGLASAMLLVGVYTILLARLSDAEPCNCFSNGRHAVPARSARRRNVVLLAANGVAGILVWSGAATAATFGGPAVAAAALIAAAAGGAALARMVTAGPPALPRTGKAAVL